MLLCGALAMNCLPAHLGGNDLNDPPRGVFTHLSLPGVPCACNYSNSKIQYLNESPYRRHRLALIAEHLPPLFHSSSSEGLLSLIVYFKLHADRFCARCT